MATIWKSCTFGTEPEQRRHIIMKRKAGYIDREWEYLSGYYDREYRPRNPWLDFSGDAISDSGEAPEFWAYVEDIMKEL